jgi:alkanesulfonate monooxygenase SsuD/methylene tetrahydromethanopterin reductase-like flavin-dependent oxidoreductase (luciferase family)
MYDAYRTRARELGWEAGPDRMAYAAVVGVGATRAEGLRRADQIADYVRTAPVVAEPFTNPPGYNSIGANVAIMKAGPRAHRIVKDRQGNPIDHRRATVQQFMDTDTVFAGTPDDVFNQISDFNRRMGGVGHLLFFGQGGYLSHEDAAENIRLFGREVASRLRELTAEPAQLASSAAE